MRARTAFLITILTFGHQVTSAQDPKAAKPATKPAAPATQAGAKPAATTKPAEASAAAASDETAIRQSGESYVKAFNKGDAKAVADYYTKDAEYIDERGILVQGRSKLEESLKNFFVMNPGTTLELRVDSIRILGTGIAIEDGVSVTKMKNGEQIACRYAAVHQKSDGKWLVASVRETAIKEVQHRTQLKQLDWMVGEWVHEGDDAVVVFQCKPEKSGNFLIRDFTVRIAGQEPISGTQRIGWDSQAEKFKAWTFDSNGGHSEGYWHRDGDSWVLKATGVTADGKPASSTTLYTFVNPHTMTFQTVDHEVSGIELPDGPKLKIVKHPPKPE